MQQLAKDILVSLETKMNKAQEVMLKNFCDIRTGTANPNILDKIAINYYGARTFLKTLSSISVSEGNQLNIKPYDSNLIPNIKKVLLESNLGITPQTDGLVVRLVFPKPTEERRKTLMKEVEQLAEKTKVAIRNVRREGNYQIKKVELTKDLEIFYLNQIQTLTDQNIKLIDKHATNKNNELLKA